MDIETIITRALQWEKKNGGNGDYTLNGKKGKFFKLEKDKPLNLLPAIVDPERDLCTFPMHSYVEIGKGSYKSFMCRKDDSAVPQIDDKGNLVLYIWQFGKNLKQLLDASAALDKGKYDNWVQTLTKTGEGLNTSYNLVRNNKDFKVDPKAIEKAKETYASPWDYLVENVKMEAYQDFIDAQKEAEPATTEE